MNTPRSPRSSSPATGSPAPTSHNQQTGAPDAPATYPQVERRVSQRERRTDAADSTGLERRRGPGRRLTDFLKAAEEGEMNQEQFMFLMAIDAFKRSNNVMYPTWTDVLEVVRLLGYRKTMPSELKLGNAEDWTEPANSPTKVRSKPGHPEAGWTDDREAA
jgi:hypothetical protein